MRGAVAMSDVNFFGADGGRLAMAFASGCVATFAFVSAIGGFLWKMIGRSRQDRIEELTKCLDEERARCSAMEDRLVNRIEQLETILMFEMAGNTRQKAQLAIAEIRRDYDLKRTSSEPEEE